MALFRRKNINRKLYLSDKGAAFNYIEAYKALRTNIDFLASTNHYKTFIVTSATPGEGKTNVAINLAKTLADGGKKVILVDGDLRKGTIATYLKINRNTPGIAQYLGKNARLSEVIAHHDEFDMDVLTTGAILTNASEAMGAEVMQELIKVLYEMYDFVIIDTPPVSVVTDAAILSRYVDGVMLVVRSGVTTKQAMRQSKKILDDVNANVLGVILNDYNVKKLAYGGDYYGYGNETIKKRKKRKLK